MKKVLLIITVIHLLAIPASAQNNKDTLVENIELKSTVFNNTRNLRILLPPGYYDTKNTHIQYPVLYLNDGFAVFKRWNIRETLYKLIELGEIAPLIIVGIDNAINNINTSADFRTREYLPFPEESETTVPDPQGKLYPDFLVQEVMPVINQQYRILKGSDNTGIGGSSYGGYIAFYTYLARPGIFGRLLLESTPFFLSGEKIISLAEEHKNWFGKIIIGLGDKESDDEAINKKGRTAQEKVVAIIKKHSGKVKFREIITPGATHGSKAWAERFPGNLKFLFGYSQ